MEKENSNITHLYFIRDRLSKAAETAVIQSMNDAVACRGFLQFLTSDEKRRESENLPAIGRIERELVHICALDEDNHVLPEEDGFTENSYRVVCNGENVENMLEEFRDNLRG